MSFIIYSMYNGKLIRFHMCLLSEKISAYGWYPGLNTDIFHGDVVISG